MSVVVPFRRKPGVDDGGEGEDRLSPAEWLRKMADFIEAEKDDTTMQPPAMVLVIMNESPDGDRYRTRLRRYDCSRVEAVGLLGTAVHDYNIGSYGVDG